MSSNYDYSQQQLQRKLGSPLKPYPSPLRTPRPERKRLEPRSANCNSDRTERNQEVNVQVLLRCRPLNDDEVRMNVAKVISCDEQRREVTVLKNIANKQVDRTFTFDKVFGSKAQQRTIYDHAISPIVGEVLEGFNCTVFAYGQTGTGKTYTMEGGMRTKGGELPVDAGIIPRVVRQIFDTLEAQNADYSVKVTFLELYNEEITDLLAHDDYIRSCEDKLRKPISLVEDGKGGVIVRGLEEEVVYSASDIYNLLERGSAKRRTADTLLNRRSSRSHSIFSISIHIKEASIGDEELIKCGKLNLVDLAGSENISRSAVRESRAREAGEINKSLLTLGRVVTALVEHSGHTPYRDSKLTRLLRDSLGGKTKTCIIATVSPSVHCLEETLSTLDYAYRAKNIKNKPEANQKMLKAALLKDLYLEIERMRQDVRAAREKNGVYIPHERFLQDEAERKAMAEKIDHLEFDLDLKQKQVDEFQALYSTEQEKNQNLESELKEFRINLEKSHRTLHELQENYRIAKWTLKEKEFIISNFLHSENSLVERATELRANLETASEDITALFTKIDHKNKLETENRNMVLAFGSHLDQSIENLHNTVIGSVSQQQQQLSLMREHFCSFILSKGKATELLESRIKKIKAVYASGVKSMLELAHALEEKNSSNLEHLKSTVSDQTMAVKAFLSTAVSETEQVLHDIQSSLVEQENMLALSAQQQEEGLQRSMDLAHIISKTTIDFFENVHNHASKLVKTVEENQTAQCRKFADFEKAFQENYVEEEKQVLEKIAEILAASTARKTNIVSEAMRNMEYMSIGEKKNLQKEMSDLQQLSTNAGKEWDLYTEKIKRQFLEYTLSAADIRSKMEHTLQECSDKVSLSRKQWEHNHLSICHLYESNTTEIESMTGKNISENQTMLEEFASVSCSTDAKFDAGACDLKSAVNDSLSLDHEAKKEMESVSTLCSEQLKILQSSNFEKISDIRNRADRCLKREYQVDQPTCTTPKRRSIMVPNLASIEELRTPSFDDLVGKMKSVNTSKPGSIEAMSSCVLSDSPRSPLTAIN